MLALERYRRRSVPPYQQANELPAGRALVIGLCHLAALWPGTSRSLASLSGALLVGLPTAAAADFAFLLALPTLGTATVYELLKERQILFAEIGLLNLSLGLLVSFAVGLLVIASFLRYLRGHGLLVFALYRVGLALAVLWLMRS
jgi:undecaprenyl-diphosphatase